MRLRLAFLAACAAGAAAQSSNACYFDSKVGATFDASSLPNPLYDWTWQDKYMVDVFNSTYVFNVCQNVVNPPAACAMKPPAPAYQLLNTGNGNQACYALGADFTKSNPKPVAKQLHDPRFNVAAGWELAYIGGESTDNCPQPRQFTLVFMCADFPFDAPSTQPNYTWVEEVNTCDYEAYSWSRIGCPTECPMVNGQLCGGHGICGYDSNAQQARCFCDDDYIEADCATPRNPFPSGAVAGTTIAGLILGMGAVGGYGYFAGRKAPAATVDGFYA